MKEGRKYFIVGATAVVICRREKGGEGIIGEGNRAGSTWSARSVDIEPYRSRQATTIGDATGLASSPVTATRWLPIEEQNKELNNMLRESQEVYIERVKHQLSGREKKKILKTEITRV